MSKIGVIGQLFHVKILYQNINQINLFKNNVRKDVLVGIINYKIVLFIASNSFGTIHSEFYIEIYYFILKYA